MKFRTALIFGIVLCSVAGAQADPRVWGPQGIPIRQGYHIKWNEAVAQDAAGNTLVVWSDKRMGNRDIRAQLFSSAGEAQWLTGGVNLTPNAHSQDMPAVAAVEGGWIVAWIDFRDWTLEGGYIGDVYAQKLDNFGNRLWPDNDFSGVAVDLADNRTVVSQSLRVVADGSGGAMMAWADNRNGAVGFYAERVSAQGDVLWNPVLTIEDQYYTQGTDAAAAAGGMVCVWARMGSADYDVYATLIMPDGSQPWGEVVTVCGAAGPQRWSQVAADGAGSCYVAWRDDRSSSTALFAQRLLTNGQPAWAADGVELYNAADFYGQVRIAPSFDSGAPDGMLAAWTDNRVTWGAAQIYAQKLSLQGVPAWTDDGVWIGGDGTSQGCYYPSVASDHNGGLVCAWSMSEGDMWENMHGFATRLNATGTPMWTAGGVRVAAEDHVQMNCAIRGNFGAYTVAFIDHDIEGVHGVRCQILNHADGARMLGASGVAAASGIRGAGLARRVAQMPDHRSVVLWQDTRRWGGGPMLYYQVVGPLGDLERAPNGEPLVPDNSGHQMFWQEDPYTCDDGSGGVFVGYVDNRSGVKLVRLAHIDHAGNRVSPDSGVVVWQTPTIRDQIACRLTPDGSGGCFVCWSGYDAQYYIDIYVLRMNANLEPVWAQPSRLMTTQDDDMIAEALPGINGTTCQVVWTSGLLGNYNISFALIDGYGNVGPTPWVVCDALGDQEHPVAVSDGSGGMYVAWEDRRNAGSHRDIYAQHVLANGTMAWADNGVIVNAGSNEQGTPKIAVNAGDLYVVWADLRNGSYTQIFAQKIGSTGELRWGVDGIGVHTGNSAWAADVIASTGRNGVIPLWHSPTSYYDQLYATHLDSTGAVYADPFWQPDIGGALGAAPPNRQWEHAASEDGWGGAVVAWTEVSMDFEDEGDWTEDIYAQRIFDYTTAADDVAPLLPDAYALHQNYPNPFNPETMIGFDLPVAGMTSLKVFDLTGREVATLVSGPLAAGTHDVAFDAGALPSGVYIYRLEAADFQQARKLVLLR